MFDSVRGLASAMNKPHVIRLYYVAFTLVLIAGLTVGAVRHRLTWPEGIAIGVSIIALIIGSFRPSRFKYSLPLFLLGGLSIVRLLTMR